MKNKILILFVIIVLSLPLVFSQITGPRNKCGNGVCDEGEAMDCPTDGTMRPCLAGTCPQDCEKDSCPEDAKVCPDGSTVIRDPDKNCQFKPCPVKACSADAKICLDGSGVGRDPNNNCEFYPCPQSCETCPEGYVPNGNSCDPSCLSAGCRMPSLECPSKCAEPITCTPPPPPSDNCAWKPFERKDSNGCVVLRCGEWDCRNENAKCEIKSISLNEFCGEGFNSVSWTCSDGQQSQNSSLSCKPAGSWIALARSNCMQNCKNSCPEPPKCSLEAKQGCKFIPDTDVNGCTIGCGKWVCEPICKPIAPPSKDFCEDGEIIPIKEKGCIVGYDCENEENEDADLEEWIREILGLR